MSESDTHEAEEEKESKSDNLDIKTQSSHTDCHDEHCHETDKNIVRTGSESTGGGTDITGGMNGINSSKYITNKNYFINDPTHGNYRRGIDDKEGTCVVIATQMLLGYHNYYSDRRLINEFAKDGTKRYLHQDFGDITMAADPDALGTTQDFYIRMIDYVDTSLINGQRLWNATDGVEAYLIIENIPADCKDDFIYGYYMATTGSSVLHNSIKAEIDADRPCIIGMSGLTVDSWHVVPCYGYMTLNGTQGYIIHYGWSDGRSHVWTNKNWYFQYMWMQSGHSHNYGASTYYTNTTTNISHHQKICTICGQNAPTGEHSYTVYSFYNTQLHKSACVCGKEDMLRSHNFRYEVDIYGHNTICSDCGYTVGYESHYYKSGNRCWNCNYVKV